MVRAYALLLTLVASSSAFAEPDGHTSLPPLAPEIESCVVALLQGAPNPQCPPAPAQPAPTRPLFVYKSDFKAALRLVLEYRSPDHEAPLRVDVGFGNDAVSVRSSHARVPQLAGGVRMRRAPQKGAMVVLEGRDGADLLVATWPVPTPEVPLGVLLCPFELTTEKADVPADQALALLVPKQSRYIPTAVQYQFQGSVSGSINTIRGVGEAVASIETTPNLPASDPFEDRVRSGDPEVDLEYMQLGGAVAPAWHPWSGEATVGGAVLRLRFHLDGRFEKTLQRTRAVWIGQRSIPGGLMATVRQREVTLPSERCTLVVSQIQAGE